MNATATDTIRKEIFVDASPETAFRVFTEQIPDWWPLAKYGIFLDCAANVVFEDRDGWRLTEKAKDGRETVWGEVIPRRCRPKSSSRSSRTATARMSSEHRGWEKLAEELRGARTGYGAGWDEVLAEYRAAS